MIAPLQAISPRSGRNPSKSDPEQFIRIAPSHNKGCGWVIIAVFLLWGEGCASISPPQDSPQNDNKKSSFFSANNDDLENLDFGADWERNIQQSGAIPGSSGANPGWTIALNTFTGQNHPAAAANMISQVNRIAPETGEMRVQTSDKGSKVVHGFFTKPGNPDARRELQRIKGILYQRRPLFSGAMFTRIPRAAPRTLHPHDLRTVRRKHPRVNQIYTLSVAVWGDFDSGEWSPARLHRAAEAQVRELRSRGFEAYFHHDDEKLLSDVTVGIFGSSAIDPQSGVLSLEVLALIKQFPHRLVNGEPLQVPLDPRRPASGTRTQMPMLVEVPR